MRRVETVNGSYHINLKLNKLHKQSVKHEKHDEMKHINSYTNRFLTLLVYETQDSLKVNG